MRSVFSLPREPRELTGISIIRAYHASRNDSSRTKILVPDASHGTNPASGALGGFRQ